MIWRTVMLNGSVDSNECIWWWLSDQWFLIVYSAYNELIIPFNIKHPCVVMNMCKSKQKTFWFGGCSIWVEDGINHWRTKWQCSDSRFRIIYIIWLVVWTIFIFPYIGNFIIPTDELIFFVGVETTNQIPSGKLTVCYGKSPSLIGKSTNEMGHFQ